MDMNTILLWVGFNVFVCAMLALDLGVFNRKAHVVSIKEATIWSVVWISLAMLFNLGIWFFMGPQKGLEFFTGYVIEKSLSVDNIFVFVLVFSAFAVPAAYQHRVLFWGVLGALVMRGALIVLGSALITTFHWIIFVFGAFLVFTGARMAFHRDEEIHPEKNPVVNLARRFLPIAPAYDKDHFFTRQGGKLMATPLLLVLLVVESSDLVFAVDSIPAIFAVTQDAFIVYTSNVFAILGLRSLYFVLANVVQKFVYLKLGLAAILVFVGAKMLLIDIYKIPVFVSLLVIAAILTIAIVASLIRTRNMGKEKQEDVEVPAEETPEHLSAHFKP